MGGEFGQHSEWQHDGGLQWELLEQPAHAALITWLGALNDVYSREQALHQRDFDPAGFEWIDANASEQSVVSFLRKANTNDDLILVVCNFTPVLRSNYRLGVPRGGYWREILNSDASDNGGSGHGNYGGVEASSIECHGRPFSVNLTLPPLSALFFKSEDPSWQTGM
jgi:1,4-alpha-glucan branching enzyme